MLNLHTVFSAESIGETKLTRKTLGLLRTSGEIAAYDPLTVSDAKSFMTRVPAGAWPVEILLGERRGDTRVELARVRFFEGEPTRFELALVEGQDVRTLGAKETFGYGVDAGVGCFAGDGGVGSEWILRTLQKNDESTWSYAISEGLIAFSSGYGDGVYSSYFAYDNEGQLVSLTTNFSGFELELPSHATDAAFRQARATELFETLLQGLPRLGGDEYGDVWTESMDLVSLREAAAHLIPRFLDVIQDTQPRCDPEDSSAPDNLALDLWLTTLGRLLGNADADMRFARESARLDDDTLVRILAKRHRPSPQRADKRGQEALSAALLARSDSASAPVLLHALRLLGSERASLHPRLPELAVRALQVALEGPAQLDSDEPFAEALIDAAVEPFRHEHVSERNERVVHPAPEALIDLALRSLERFDEEQAQRALAGLLIAQGRATTIAEYAERTGRLEPLLALTREPAYTAMANAKLAALASDASRTIAQRWEAVACLRDARARCASLLELGLEGFEAAPTQLGYLEESVQVDVLNALDRLAKNAPTKTLKQNAAETAKRIRKQKAKRAR